MQEESRGAFPEESSCVCSRDAGSFAIYRIIRKPADYTDQNGLTRINICEHPCHHPHDPWAERAAKRVSSVPGHDTLSIIRATMEEILFALAIRESSFDHGTWLQFFG